MPFCRTTNLLLFLFLWINTALTQNYPGRNYTAAGELPNNTVRSLLVDSQNILWVGTDNGVVKKENEVFHYYFEENGLALNSCWAIAEDKNNKIWFGSYGAGVSIYDGAHFRIISKDDGLVHDEITELFSHKNWMYIGTSDGISRIDINSFEIDSWDLPHEEPLMRLSGFFEFKEEVYATTYNTGIFKISGGDGKSLEKLNDHHFIYSLFKAKDSIYSSNKGFIFKSSLEAYLQKGETSPRSGLGHSIIWDYAKTMDNKLFAAAWGIYDSTGGIYEIVNNELISRTSDFNIPSNEVISLAYDAKFEKLFVGTRDEGLFEIRLNSQIQFHKIPGKEVLGFAHTANSTAVLLNDGLFLKAGKKEHKIGLVQLKSWQEDYISETSIPLPAHEDDFYELNYDTPAKDIRFYDIKPFQEAYWLNTNIGIFVINEYGKPKRYLPLHSEEINFTPQGNLVETHPYGGARVYSDFDKFEYTYFSKEDAQTPTMIVNSERRNNRTYFTSVFSGLYTRDNKKFRSYLDEGTWKEEKLRHITSIGNDLAISTEFGDVIILNDGESFEILKKIPRASIEGNSISFLEEYDGNLLIGTEKGLTIYKDDRFIFLDEEQGLKQPLLSAGLRDGTLLIGSKNGFYSIDLDDVSNTNSIVDQLEIQELNINNESSPFEGIKNEEYIELAYDENTLQIEFSTNAHPFPNKLSYQYRLNESDNWSPASSNPEIFLPFLPPGNYKLEVKVTDASTGLSYKQPLLEFAILPPFWKTWWFILLIISHISAGIFVIYKIQIRQHKKFEKQKRLIQKRVEETKMEALLAQMNPHFIFNAMNSIQNYILDSDIDKASVFLNDFARLIRLNLDHCTKPRILLVEEIEYLQSYIRIENTRFNDAIKVHFEIDPLIDTYDVEIPTMLLQTFVENTFVHAFPPEIENPELKLSFKWLAEGVLECRIEDNGIGFTANSGNQLHISKGVSLVKERLALLGYDIEQAIQIRSEKNQGTSVRIILQV